MSIRDHVLIRYFSLPCSSQDGLVGPWALSLVFPQLTHQSISREIRITSRSIQLLFPEMNKLFVIVP